MLDRAIFSEKQWEDLVSSYHHGHDQWEIALLPSWLPRDSRLSDPSDIVYAAVREAAALKGCSENFATYSGALAGRFLEIAPPAIVAKVKRAVGSTLLEAREPAEPSKEPGIHPADQYEITRQILHHGWIKKKDSLPLQDVQDVVLSFLSLAEPIIAHLPIDKQYQLFMDNYGDNPVIQATLTLIDPEHVASCKPITDPFQQKVWELSLLPEHHYKELLLLQLNVISHIMDYPHDQLDVVSLQQRLGRIIRKLPSDLLFDKEILPYLVTHFGIELITRNDVVREDNGMYAFFSYWENDSFTFTQPDRDPVLNLSWTFSDTEQLLPTTLKKVLQEQRVERLSVENIIEWIVKERPTFLTVPEQIKALHHNIGFYPSLRPYLTDPAIKEAIKQGIIAQITHYKTDDVEKQICLDDWSSDPDPVLWKLILLSDWHCLRKCIQEALIPEALVKDHHFLLDLFDTVCMDKDKAWWLGELFKLISENVMGRERILHALAIYPNAIVFLSEKLMSDPEIQQLVCLHPKLSLYSLPEHRGFIKAFIELAPLDCVAKILLKNREYLADQEFMMLFVARGGIQFTAAEHVGTHFARISSYTFPSDSDDDRQKLPPLFVTPRTVEEAQALFQSPSFLQVLNKESFKYDSEASNFIRKILATYSEDQELAVLYLNNVLPIMTKLGIPSGRYFTDPNLFSLLVKNYPPVVVARMMRKVIHQIPASKLSELLHFFVSKDGFAILPFLNITRKTKSTGVQEPVCDTPIKMAALAQNGLVARVFHSDEWTLEMAKIAVQNDPRAIFYLPPQIKAQL